jgi:hypothetical protein
MAFRIKNMNNMNQIHKRIVEYMFIELKKFKTINIEKYDLYYETGNKKYFENPFVINNFGLKCKLDKHFYDLLENRNIKMDFSGIEPDFTDAIFMCDEINKYYLQNENFDLTMDLSNKEWVFKMYSYVVIRAICDKIHFAEWSEMGGEHNIWNRYLDELCYNYPVWDLIQFVKHIWFRVYKEEKEYLNNSSLIEKSKNYKNYLNKKKIISRILNIKFERDCVYEIVKKY